MGKRTQSGGRIQGFLLNSALVACSLVLLVLLYSFAARSFLPKMDPARAHNPGALVGDIIQVEVRNGCGADGAAARLTRHLREHGFDVVEVGDHVSFDQAHTVVIDRAGNPEAAQMVARAIGLPAAAVVQDVRPDFYLDASVIIGHDYHRLRPFRESFFSSSAR